MSTRSRADASSGTANDGRRFCNNPKDAGGNRTVGHRLWNPVFPAGAVAGAVPVAVTFAWSRFIVAAVFCAAVDDRGSCHGCRILFRQHRARQGERNDSCAIFRRLPATGLLKMPGRAGSSRVQAERSRVRRRAPNRWRRPDHHSRRRNETADKRFADRGPTQLSSRRPMNRFRARRRCRWRCKSSRHPGFTRVCAGSMMHLRVPRQARFARAPKGRSQTLLEPRQ